MPLNKAVKAHDPQLGSELPEGAYYVANFSDTTSGWNDGCIVWWRENGHGYSNYIENAGVFSKKHWDENYPPRKAMWVPVETIRELSKTRTYCWLRDLPDAYRIASRGGNAPE